MIEFNSESFFARLTKVANDKFSSLIKEFMIDGEEIVGAYKSTRDGVIFTNKRIITVSVQGVTGKKKDFTSIPYRAITTFSLETTGVFDSDAELEIYVAAVGKIKFELAGATDIQEICKTISMYTL